MKRRTLLKLGAAANLGCLSGCLDSIGADNEGAGDESETTATEEPTGESENPADSTVENPDVAIESASATGDASFDARVASPPSEGEPATLSLDLTNTAADARTYWSFSGSNIVPFNQAALSIEDGDETIQLVSSGTVLKERGCWVSDVIALARIVPTLDPGESVTADVDIVTGASTITDDESTEREGGCYRSGTYHGEQSFDVYPGDANPGSIDRGDEQTVGAVTLSLAVSLE